MKRREQDELLNELLTGDEVADFRKSSLESGLAAVRRQKHQRRAARMVAMMLVPLLVVAGILIYRSERTRRQMASVKPVVSLAAAKPAKDAGVKIISDEELFALFPGRSMALVGKPGEQKLVFLDGGGARARVQ